MTATVSARGFRRQEPTEEPERKRLSLRQIKTRLRAAAEVRSDPGAYSDALAELASELDSEQALRWTTILAGSPLFGPMSDVLDVIEVLEEHLGSEDQSGYWRPHASEEPEEQRELSQEEAAIERLFL